MRKIAILSILLVTTVLISLVWAQTYKQWYDYSRIAQAAGTDLLIVDTDPNGLHATKNVGRDELLLSWQGSSTLSAYYLSKAVYDVSADGRVDGNDVAYGAAWNADVNAPSMNAVYDKVEALAAASGDMLKATYDVSADGRVDGNDVAYGAAWNGDVNAPSMNAVYDKVEALEPALTDLASLIATLSDVTKFITDDDIVGPSADPDVDASGELGIDTDGANEPNDGILRTSDTGGDTQYALAQVLKTIQATIVKPQDMADATRDLCVIWHNNTGMIFTITEIMAWSPADDTTVTVELVTATDFSAPATVDALEIATNGTSVFTCTETTITDATVAHDEILTLDFDDTDDPGWVKISITGYFNADVN